MHFILNVRRNSGRPKSLSQGARISGTYLFVMLKVCTKLLGQPSTAIRRLNIAYLSSQSEAVTSAPTIATTPRVRAPRPPPITVVSTLKNSDA